MQNLLTTLFQYEDEIYAVLFLITVVLAVCVEERAPCRPLHHSVKTRWFSNLSLGILNNFLAHWFIPSAAIFTVLFTGKEQWGLMNQVHLPAWLEITISLLFLDFVRYCAHRLYHRVPVLWRLHRLHHTDLDIDYSTQFRFHPLETFSSAAITLPFIALFSPAVEAILLHKLVFVVTSFFVHANTRLPANLERVAGLIFTTPDIHKVHHSTTLSESNANFGALFSFWDRLLGTFVAHPQAGVLKMEIGVKEMQDPKHLRLGWMLLNPFLTADNEDQPPSINSPATTKVTTLVESDAADG